MNSFNRPVSFYIRVIALMITLTVPVFAFAGGGGGHGGIPFTVVLQAINFALYLGILYFVLKTPVRQFFRSREENYKQALVKAEAAKTDAEKKKNEIHQRLTNLEGTSQASIDNARAEAAALVAQIEQQGKDMAERLKQEAIRMVGFELERARAALREEMLTEAVVMSKKILADRMAEPDQKRLQTEFVDKIREVQA